MKHNLTICIAAQILFIGANSCSAMNSTPTIYSQLTAIKKPHEAIYLTNELIAVRSNNGCSIIDREANKEYIKITNKYCQHLTAHPKRPLLAIACNKNLKIFNYETKEKIWSTIHNNHITSSIFNPHDTIITIRNDTVERINEVTEHNYITKQKRSYPLLFCPIAYHPTAKTTLSQYDSQINFSPHPITNKYETLQLNISPVDCQYNPNGSIIATHDSNQICLIEIPSSPSQYLEILKYLNRINNVYSYDTIKFYPRGSVLATLSRNDQFRVEIPKYVLAYWDVEQQEIINETPVYIKEDILNYHLSAISFTPNGKEIIVTAYRQHIIFPVPFEVIYQKDTRENFSYLLFLLKNLKPDQAIDIPQDITKLLAHILLQAHKR
jgi:hypothetical protein